MLTHTIYGRSKIAAVLSIGQNLMMVTRIKIHRTIITKMPLAGDRSPKKATFHRTLTTSCAVNKKRAAFAASFLGTSRQTRKREMPIRVNRIIQIIPIIEPGGVKEGLMRVGYQFIKDLDVIIEPITPAI